MKVKVNYSDLPKGAIVQVHGIGDLENGTETELDKEQVDFWKLMNDIERAPSILMLTDEKQTVLEHVEVDSSATDPQPVVNEPEAPADADKEKK